MARFLTLTSGGNIQGGKRKKTLRPKVKIGPVALCFVSLIILSLISLFYLAQANQIATKGYEIKKLENRLNDLQASNHKLELRSAELQAVSSVEAESKQLNMVPIQKMIYISGSGTAMAYKRN